MPLLFSGELCPAGTFNNITGLRTALECTPCTPGYYCPNPGLEEPFKLCSAGYYCESRSTEAAPDGEVYGYKCPKGHFCPEGTPVPVPCPSGTYQPSEGLSSCCNVRFIINSTLCQ